MEESELVPSGAREATYVYYARRYLFDVKVPAGIGVCAIVAGPIMIARNILAPIAVVLTVVALYVLVNTLVAHAYPETVRLSATELSLTSFGRTDTYALSELTRLQVRENGQTHSAYIRVNGGGLLRGRYFVGCGDMRDADGAWAEGLYRFFLDTEARLDPENIRVRARRADERKESARGAEPGAPQSRRHQRKKK